MRTNQFKFAVERAHFWDNCDYYEIVHVFCANTINNKYIIVWLIENENQITEPEMKIKLSKRRPKKEISTKWVEFPLEQIYMNVEKSVVRKFGGKKDIDELPAFFIHRPHKLVKFKKQILKNWLYTQIQLDIMVVTMFQPLPNTSIARWMAGIIKYLLYTDGARTHALRRIYVQIKSSHRFLR